MSNEKFTVAQMVKALKHCKGMVYLAAEHLGCHHQTVYNYIAKHPKVKAASEFESGKMLDVSEMTLYNAIMDGQAWAVSLHLKTKGKNRGYVERQEQSGPDGGPVPIQVQAIDYDAAIAPITRGSGTDSTAPGDD